MNHFTITKEIRKNGEFWWDGVRFTGVPHYRNIYLGGNLTAHLDAIRNRQKNISVVYYKHTTLEELHWYASGALCVRFKYHRSIASNWDNIQNIPDRSYAWTFGLPPDIVNIVPVFEVVKDFEGAQIEKVLEEALR